MTDSVIETKKVVKISPPKMWKVIFHNDDFTPFDFVQAVLIKQYNKSHDDAINIAQKVHNTGKGIVGTYTKEIAATKIEATIKTAIMFGFPLLATMEEN